MQTNNPMRLCSTYIRSGRQAVLDSLSPFKALAQNAQQNDCKIVMQINHPGRQVFKKMGGKILSPSDVALNMGKHSNLFAPPTPMTEQDIQEVKQRFITTATLAQQAGYDGVQIHACLLYTSPSPRDISGSRMPSSA